MGTRALSSWMTFFYKFVFPTIWIGGFGAGTLALWSGALSAPHGARRGPPAPEEMKWIFLCAWIAGTSFIVWFARPLKQVRLGATELLISNYRREIRVPLHEVERVRFRWAMNPRSIVVEFARETPFGWNISFIPRLRFGLCRDPTAAELEERVAQAKRELPSG